MIRFFTKKSVAILFTAFMLFGLFNSCVYAETPAFTAPADVDTSSSNSELDATENQQSATAQPAVTQEDIQATKTNEKGWFAGLKGFFNKAIGGIAGLVTGIVGYLLELITIPIASIFLVISGKILNFTIQYTIYGDGFNAMTSVIKTVWVLIRDTANIAFIFLLLYAAIKQIITGEAATKALKSIIIAAVLINFSLFITKVLIDAGNIVATAIYNQIEPPSKTEGLSSLIGNATEATLNEASKLSGTNTLNNKKISITLSESLMGSLGLKTLYDTNNDITPTGIEGIINAFIRLILFLITAFVFIAMSAILVGRYVMLIFLMASSPIGFLGDTVPMLKDLSKKWSTQLQNNILIAPTFMFFVLLIIKLSKNISAQTSSDPMVIYFNYFLIIFLLIKALEITKGLSNFGSMVDKIAAGATGLALGAATGGTALLARSTLGRGANMLANSSFGQTLKGMEGKKGALGFIAGKTLGGVQGVAKSSFDVRNAKIGKDNVGKMMGNVGGLNLAGDNAKGGGSYGKFGTGFAGLQAQKDDKNIKEQESRNKSYESAKSNYVADQKEKEEKIKEQIRYETDPKKKAKLQSNLHKIEDNIKTGGADFSQAEEKINKYQKEKDVLEREREAKQEEISQRLLNLGDISDEEYQAKLMEYAEEYSKTLEAQSTLDKEFNEAVQLLDKAKTNPKLGGIMALQTSKKHFAKHIRERNKFLHQNTKDEDNALARKIEKTKSKEDIEKEKRLADEAKARVKAEKEWEKDHPQDTK